MVGLGKVVCSVLNQSLTLASGLLVILQELDLMQQCGSSRAPSISFVFDSGSESGAY